MGARLTRTLVLGATLAGCAPAAPVVVLDVKPPPASEVVEVEETPSAEPEPATEEAPVGSARDAAIAFVEAIALRDDAAAGALLLGDADCEQMGKVKSLSPHQIDTCKKTMGEDRDDVVAAYREKVPADFEVGAVTEEADTPLDGLWMITIEPKQAEPGHAVEVVLLSTGARWVVVVGHAKRE